jgi:hypothetical protein
LVDKAGPLRKSLKTRVLRVHPWRTTRPPSYLLADGVDLAKLRAQTMRKSAASRPKIEFKPEIGQVLFTLPPALCWPPESQAAARRAANAAANNVAAWVDDKGGRAHIPRYGQYRARLFALAGVWAKIDTLNRALIPYNQTKEGQRRAFRALSTTGKLPE